MLRRNFLQSIPFLSSIPFIGINDKENLPIIEFAGDEISNINYLFDLSDKNVTFDNYIKSAYGNIVLPDNIIKILKKGYNAAGSKDYTNGVIECHVNKMIAHMIGYPTNIRRCMDHWEFIDWEYTEYSYIRSVYLTISRYHPRKNELTYWLRPADQYWETTKANGSVRV